MKELCTEVRGRIKGNQQDPVKPVRVSERGATDATWCKGQKREDVRELQQALSKAADEDECNSTQQEPWREMLSDEQSNLVYPRC